MRFWEDNKWLASVAGGFLVVYLLVSLIVLIPNAAAVSSIEEKAIRDYGIAKETLFPERTSGKEKIKDLLSEYNSYNAALETRLHLLEKMISRPFEKNLEPVVKLVEFGSAVRAELDKHRLAIMKQAGYRGVTILEGAQELIGRELSATLADTKEKDIDWLQQTRVAYEFASLLLEISSVEEGKLCIQEIQNLDTYSREEVFLKSAEASTDKAPVEPFVYLYPLSAQLLVSQEGIMRILNAFSDPETYFLLQAMKISSDPGGRTVESREEKGKKNIIGKQRITKWNEHYYVVNLEVARVEVNISEGLKGSIAEESREKTAKTTTQKKKKAALEPY
ncbi:MAG: hypothetical protein JXA52_02050 [Planctomycetes bacterium]|nr:hypothetical protein [Planctomycetota bacterium]